MLKCYALVAEKVPVAGDAEKFFCGLFILNCSFLRNKNAAKRVCVPSAANAARRGRVAARSSFSQTANRGGTKKARGARA